MLVGLRLVGAGSWAVVVLGEVGSGGVGAAAAAAGALLSWLHFDSRRRPSADLNGHSLVKGNEVHA